MQDITILEAVSDLRKEKQDSVEAAKIAVHQNRRSNFERLRSSY